jgi:hypothetical protein
VPQARGRHETSNTLLVYQVPPVEKIRERLREEPRSAVAATTDIAFSRLDALEAAKTLNGIKGWILAVAMSFEALAVGCVAVAVAARVSPAPTCGAILLLLARWMLATHVRHGRLTGRLVPARGR